LNTNRLILKAFKIIPPSAILAF